MVRNEQGVRDEQAVGDEQAVRVEQWVRVEQVYGSNEQAAIWSMSSDGPCEFSVSLWDWGDTKITWATLPPHPTNNF